MMNIHICEKGKFGFITTKEAFKGRTYLPSGTS